MKKIYKYKNYINKEKSNLMYSKNYFIKVNIRKNLVNHTQITRKIYLVLYLVSVCNTFN